MGCVFHRKIRTRDVLWYAGETQHLSVLLTTFGRRGSKRRSSGVKSLTGK